MSSAGGRGFSYRSVPEVEDRLQELQVDLPFSEHTELMNQKLVIAGRTVQNRIVCQPMQSCGGKVNGGPDRLTKRRYIRLAEGGAGIIWFESVAVLPEARSQSRHMWLDEHNVEDYKILVQEIKEACFKKNGFEPIILLQLSHSGRYCKPQGVLQPVIVRNNPLFEVDGILDASYIIGDEELKRLEQTYGACVRLAGEAGFDGVDIKACHQNLINELLSAYNRPGEYGGSFFNRVRFLQNCFEAAHAAVPKEFIVTTRLSIYDGFPYPYGFGTREYAGLKPDVMQVIEIIQYLDKLFDLPLANISMGNPYINPHIERPYDRGTYIPDEHPLVSVARIVNCTAQVQKACGNVKLVASGLSYLRQFSAQLAAGILEKNYAALVGFGRMSVADPYFPQRLLKEGALSPQRLCTTCGYCTACFHQGRRVKCRGEEK